jgi:hypothetical protein
MWCRNCQQDVPAIGSTDGSAARCARCHKSFAGDSSTKGTGNPHDIATGKRGGPKPELNKDWLEQALLDDWELDDELNEAQQLVASLGARERVNPAIRLDGAHAPGEKRDAASIRQSAKKLSRSKSAQSSFFSWCILSIGLMAFVFGAVLIGWSIAEDRQDLWRLGLPFTLGGQAALIVGLVFQLDGLWRSNREASETLEELDSQLDELRHATSMISATHSSPAQSFYLHLADGASPNLLLADLKGQLDLLASRLADKH